MSTTWFQIQFTSIRDWFEMAIHGSSTKGRLVTCSMSKSNEAFIRVEAQESCPFFSEWNI